jgi:DNA polymerase III epsilon subunit-like protein
MNYQDIVFLDFETTGVNPHRAQPTQLAAVVIHGRKLEVHPNSLFCSYIQPVFDEAECARLGLDPVTEEVLDKTHITMTQLKNAPSLKSVWGEFRQYVNKYNPKKSKWGAPIKAGMNIDKYDGIIIDRICGGHFGRAKIEIDKLVAGGIIQAEGAKIPEPYGFGPWGVERGEEELFYPRDSVDLLRILWMWTENMTDIKSLSMDAMREWLGISSEGSHTADKDVLDGAHMLIKFLKLHRNFAPKVKFKDSFKKDESKISQ